MPDFIQQQRAFTAHIRNPECNLAPIDIEDRRMEVYRDLFYNNVQSLLASTYPVLRNILHDDQWHTLVRDYFSKHQARTPLFPQMPSEFLRYLEEERESQPEDLPFLWELAHYEWAELGLSIDTHEIDWQQQTLPKNVLSAMPILSPLAWVFAYRFPVHKLSPDYQPTNVPKQATYLVLYRDPEDEVHFAELSPISARLLSLIEEAQGQQTGQSLLESICIELKHPKPEIVIQGGQNLLHDFYQKHILTHNT